MEPTSASGYVDRGSSDGYVRTWRAERSPGERSVPPTLGEPNDAVRNRNRQDLAGTNALLESRFTDGQNGRAFPIRPSSRVVGCIKTHSLEHDLDVATYCREEALRFARKPDPPCWMSARVTCWVAPRRDFILLVTDCAA